AGAAAAVVLLAVGIPLLLSLGSSGKASGPNPFSPSATHSTSASPAPQHITVPTSGSQPPNHLPPGAVHKVGAHTVILVGNKLWWCTTVTPRPTGCRLMDLSKVPPRLRQRLGHVTSVEKCGTDGIELPSAPGGGGGVQVTFNPRTFEASLTTLTR